jgi:hypothetical protein
MSCDEPVVRLDLDDLGGEICLLDWGSCCRATGGPSAALGPPTVRRHLARKT